MTYTVSSGTFNSTIPYHTWSFSHQIWYTRWLLRSVSDFEATWCGVGIVFTLKHEACSCRAWTCVGEGAGWSAVCGGVYITDPVLVDLGYDHVAFHREVKNLRISIFQLLKLSPSTVCTGKRVFSKFCMWEILVSRKKLGWNKFDFFQFSRKQCGIFAYRLHSFTEIGRLYRIAENNSEISLKLFRQRAPNTF